MPLSGNSQPQPFGKPEDGPSIEEAITDAQARPLDFPATERAVYIRAMVKRTRELQATGRTAYQIRGLLPEFARDYPYLFEMVTENPDYDQASLNTMIAMLERMGQGTMNHHQATVVVGQRLAEKYIKKSD
jgi:hypothetical protein